MKFISSRISLGRIFQSYGWLCQILLFGNIVKILFAYFFPEDFLHQAGKAYLPCRGPDASPANHLFI